VPEQQVREVVTERYDRAALARSRREDILILGRAETDLCHVLNIPAIRSQVRLRRPAAAPRRARDRSRSRAVQGDDPTVDGGGGEGENLSNRFVFESSRNLAYGAVNRGPVYARRIHVQTRRPNNASGKCFAVTGSARPDGLNRNA
jgi:hypothetical protein